MMNQRIHDEFLKILAEELIPAMGCTEPIALAYAGARAREVLGCLPDRVIAHCSGNMIKNVRCVTIPNSEHMVGIEAGVMLGIVGGNASKCMEVLEDLTDEDRKTASAMLKDGVCTVEYLDSEIPLHIILELHKDASVVTLEVRYDHTNITKITKDGEVLFSSDHMEGGCSLADRSLLSVDNIKDFADQVPLKDIHELLDRVIIHNMNIAYEGMAGNYGLGIGKIIKESYPDGVAVRMKAYAAAGSEARMGGCDMPVIINSGSGNQGIASSVPVIVYARENNICQERLYRALAFSSLLTIYQKEFIGKLSAFCGAVSASCASGAAITYLVGGTLEQIKNTIGNVLANIPGIICDGAKPSCAGKIAAAVDAGIMGYYMYLNGQQFKGGDGIVSKGVENTITNVGRLGKDGMRETDKEIIRIMTEC